MKFNSDKEKVQFIVLCCLIVLVLAFFGYRMMSSGKKAANEVSSATKPGLHSEQVALNEEQQGPVGYFLPPMTGKGRDPFSPQMFPVKEDRSVAPPPQPRPFNNSSVSVIPNFPPVAPVPVMPLPPVSGPGQSQVVDEPDPAEDLVLVGIITGHPDVAVIRGEGNARYIVKEGAEVDGMFTVESISNNSVRIISDKNIIVLKLGGNNAVQKRAR